MIDVLNLGARTYASMDRRGMHPRPLSHAIEHAHAEISEVRAAWLKRDTPLPQHAQNPHLTAEVLQLGEHPWEYRGRDGKPEGVAAELADVVLCCAYLCYRTGRRRAWPPGADMWLPRMPEDTIEVLASVRRSLVGECYFAAILRCRLLAERLGIDLDAAIERKAAYNDVRPATECRP